MNLYLKKQIKWTMLVIWLVSVFISITGTARADPNAYLDLDKEMLYLPELKLKLNGNYSTNTYNVTMKMLDYKKKFSLHTVDTVAASGSNNVAIFDYISGYINIPVMKVDGKNFSALLKWDKTQPGYNFVVIYLKPVIALTSIDRSAGIYLNRIGNKLHLWAVDEIASTIEYLGTHQINPASSQVYKLSFGQNVTGIFYSDNLRKANEKFKLSLQGAMTQGKIAMPRDAQTLSVLSQFTTLEEVNEITDQQSASYKLIQDQAKIYETVDLTLVEHNKQVEAFKEATIEVMTNAYQLHESSAEFFQTTLSNTHAKLESLNNRFLTQFAADRALVEAISTELSSNVSKGVGFFKVEILSCISSVEKQMLELKSQLERKVSTLKEEVEVEVLPSRDIEGKISVANNGGKLRNNPDNEQFIEKSTAMMERYQSQLEACFKFAVEFETLTPELKSTIEPIMENYEIIQNDSQQMLKDIEQQLEPWEIQLENEGHDIKTKLETLPLINNMMAYQKPFTPWLSKVYANTKDESKLQADIQIETRQNLTRATEQLCGNETFNIEFVLFGINIVFGTPWNDKIVTGNQNNLVFSFTGNDCIETHAGYDAVFSGPGKDTVYAGDDHDFVFAGRGDDEVHGSAGNSYTVTIGAVTMEFDIGNLIIGQAGNDKLYGGEVNADKGENGTVEAYGYTDIILGDSLLFGQAAGKDEIFGEKGMDFILGQQEDDKLENLDPGAIKINGIDVPVGSFFFGGRGDDKIKGSNTTIIPSMPLFGDFAFGSQGDDLIETNSGIDFIFGGKGIDTINAGKDTDIVFGSQDNDTINGNEGSDLLFGGSGEDKIYGSNGLLDIILGNDGNDLLSGGGGSDFILGGNGADTVNGGNSFDLIFGQKGGDTLNGNNGSDFIFGGVGMDKINAGKGIDLAFGNEDSDTIRGNSDPDVIFGNKNSKEYPEKLYGDSGFDFVWGNSGPDWIYGGDGTDLLVGNSGNDVVNGDNGLDLIFGNTGNDKIKGGNGLDIAFGNEGNDIISGGAKTDLIFGNKGNDIINGDGGIDILFGNSDNDQIHGGQNLDIMFGNTGNDTMCGNSGSDFMFGNKDQDSIDGGANKDFIFGNDGNDHLVGASDNDFVFGNTGNDYLNLGSGNDWGFGNSDSDIIDGGNGNDKLFGNRGNDSIRSGNGTDWSFGNRGNDKLRAVEGKNRAFGNRGNDTLDGYDNITHDPRDYLFGNRNNDILTGNKSNSRDFRFGGWGSDSKYWNQTKVSASIFNVAWNGSTNCQ